LDDDTDSLQQKLDSRIGFLVAPNCNGIKNDLAQRSGSKSQLAALFEASAAAPHLANLGRGFVWAAKSQGFLIHEGTLMLQLLGETEPEVRIPNGTVTLRTVALINIPSASC
jgi:hypothetical protein